MTGTLEDRGLKISRKKTEYLSFMDERDGDFRMQNKILKRVETFKYLRSMMVNNGKLDAEITHRIQAEWRNWKKVTGVLCAKKVDVKAKGKMYITVVRQAMIYCAET